MGSHSSSQRVEASELGWAGNIPLRWLVRAMPIGVGGAGRSEKRPAGRAMIAIKTGGLMSAKAPLTEANEKINGSESELDQAFFAHFLGSCFMRPSLHKTPTPGLSSGKTWKTVTALIAYDDFDFGA